MIYSKTGVTVRLERARGQRTLLRLNECGVAEESGRTFRCRSSEAADSLQAPAVENVLSVETDVLESGAAVERMTVVAGSARHRYGERVWEETRVHLHLSILHGPRRVTVELGGVEWNDSSRATLRAIASAAVSGRTETVSGALVLRPAVSAQLWPELLMAMLAAKQGGIGLRQSTHEAYRYDGRGEEIRPLALIGEAASARPDQWPNVFRPSYRVSPARAAFHLDADLPPSQAPVVAEAEAVALLSPFTILERRVRGEVLCSDGRSAFLDASVDALRATNGDPAWFPYAAGSWGKFVLVPEIRKG